MKYLWLVLFLIGCGTGETIVPAPVHEDGDGGEPACPLTVLTNVCPECEDCDPPLACEPSTSGLCGCDSPVVCEESEARFPTRDDGTPCRLAKRQTEPGFYVWCCE